MQPSFSNTVTIAQSSTQLEPLTQWMKKYATYAGVTTVQPDFDSVLAVAKACIPESQLDLSGVEQLLRSVGIDVIAQYGPERVAWIGSTSDTEVEEMLQQYQQPMYSQIRQALGVNYLWVLKIQEDFGHMKNDIFEALVEFTDMNEKPECVIIDL